MAKIILQPDVQFSGEADLEQAIYGNDFQVRIFQPGNIAQIPQDVWQNTVAMVCYHEIEVNADVLDKMPGCRVVVRAGVGFDNIDLEAAAKRGVAVCNTPDYGTTDVADHAIGLTLALLRGIAHYNSAIYENPVAGWRFQDVPTIRRLSTQVFGVVGLGRIGTAAALRAKALGMQVVFYDPYRSTGSELALGIRRVDTLAELLAISDVVSLHTPLTPETRHLISSEQLTAMKPDAVLVNTSRGGVVDLAALKDALTNGAISAAALDVLEIEPLPESHPLMQAWRAPRSAIRHKLLLSPHAAFYSPSSLVDLRQKSARTALRYLETSTSRDCLNADILNQEEATSRLGQFRREALSV
ncbi:C-terminal binding protein [Aureimonas fodinaquatilis]|uniref:C-terminal binding protein n=1 Tax=Aureimonas fodinaquatilis TaxID=2565783 RepID=A0A5B0DVD6_9HYPH|nr:C-terminal binding protein [Aureimonas fodinaquatilis]KAA0970436.1 C-terminal binding protein [Aureimonas fodinaquatilis]